jgi:glutathione S-transferase
MLHGRFAIAGQRLASGEGFFEHFTLPDAYFFWYFRRGTQFNVDVTTYPNCRAHFERVAQRPSVKKYLVLEAQTLVAQNSATS